MKVNKWTLGLAAVGLVSLTSVVKAEEAATPLMTALSSTTIGGYVDVGAQWNPGSGRIAPGFAFSNTGGGKRDGFNVNSVLVSLEKPLAEGEWSAGYRLDLQWGPDAPFVTGGSDIRQAYVALRAPVGNGLDLKLGRWDAIIGYESSDGYKNPNYTRSYAYTITPTEHTGVLATYQVVDFLTLNVGVANTSDTAGGINARSPRAESKKSYMASVAITAPESTGVLAGSALYAGVLHGDASFGSQTEDHFYLGATIATPVEGLRLGASFDYVDDPVVGGADGYAAGLYASFKATDKLGFNLRAEYAKDAGLVAYAGPGAANPSKVGAVTATVQYDLWENVISRLEARWDHAMDGNGVYGNGGRKNDYLLAANLIYKF